MLVRCGSSSGGGGGSGKWGTTLQFCAFPFLEAAVALSQLSLRPGLLDFSLTLRGSALRPGCPAEQPPEPCAIRMKRVSSLGSLLYPDNVAQAVPVCFIFRICSPLVLQTPKPPPTRIECRGWRLGTGWPVRPGACLWFERSFDEPVAGAGHQPDALTPLLAACGSPSLRSLRLDVAYNALGPRGPPPLAALRPGGTLQALALCLSHNPLQDVGLAPLAALAEWPFLRRLTLQLQCTAAGPAARRGASPRRGCHSSRGGLSGSGPRSY